MITVKGKVENGKILALEPVDDVFEGCEVEITLVEEPVLRNGSDESNGLAHLLKFIEENTLDTGITDMAHQHDHYLYGTPKRDD